MDNDKFYERLLAKACEEYPSSLSTFTSPESLQYILSPSVIRLPQSTLNVAAEAIRDFWNLSRSDGYRQTLPAEHREWLQLKNASVLMAYDFHLVNGNELRLIEINTNASGFLISALLCDENEDPRRDLFESFLNEWKDVGSPHPLESVIITDKNLDHQKMRVEHFMFQDFFRSQGLRSTVAEWNDFDLTGLIYNRHTDFYLEDEDSLRLREAALAGDVCLTPSPKEYLLLADKRRLVALPQLVPPPSAAIEKVLLKSFRVQSRSKDEVWHNRKAYVFKPVQSYGGKAVYRGQSITKKNFEVVWNENFLAQEFAPAAAIADSDFRYDLRFYVYKDRIQHSVARVYKGQITNFKTPFGGFARVQIVSK